MAFAFGQGQLWQQFTASLSILSPCNAAEEARLWCAVRAVSLTDGRVMQVYFLTTSGSVYYLCPVAPFGSSFQASSAQRLLAAASDTRDSPDSLTTLTWLQQVCDPHAASHTLHCSRRAAEADVL